MDQATLAEVFADQASFRERKAVEFPDDLRNQAAADHLRKLAETASTADPTLITAAAELSEDAPDFEVWNEMVRQEGFHTEHETAEAFLKAYIAKRSAA